MKKLVLIAAIMAAVCLADSKTVCDTVIVRQTVVDNSATVDVLLKLQEQYNQAIANMQSQFNIFLVAMAALITALGVFATLYSRKEIKRDVEKAKADMEKPGSYFNKLVEDKLAGRR